MNFPNLTPTEEKSIKEYLDYLLKDFTSDQIEQYLKYAQKRLLQALPQFKYSPVQELPLELATLDIIEYGQKLKKDESVVEMERNVNDSFE